MRDVDALLAVIGDEKALQNEKVQALRELGQSEAQAPFFTTGGLLGSTAGAMIGALLAGGKGGTKLANKAVEKLGRSIEKRANPQGDWHAVGSALANNSEKRAVAADILGSLSGGTLGLGAGLAAGKAFDKNYDSHLDVGKLSEEEFKSVLDILTSPSSSAEDKALAMRALKAQGDNSGSNLGLSSTGLALALGGLGTAIGGAAGSKLAERFDAPKGQAARLAILGFQDQKNLDNIRSANKTAMEAIGDVAGGVLFGSAGAMIPNNAPDSYYGRLKEASSGDNQSADILRNNYEAVTASQPWGELLAGGIGAKVGAFGYPLIKNRVGPKKMRELLDMNQLGSDPDLRLRGINKFGLESGYAGAVGLGLGTAAGGDYFNDPFAKQN